MPKRATDGASLDQLLCLALPSLQAAAASCPRTGPGRDVEFADWQIAGLIFCGVAKKRKSKSAQFRMICQQKALLIKLLKLPRWPARSTFFERYPQAWLLVKTAIGVQGRLAVKEHIAQAKNVAADKSLMSARGPEWNQCDRKRNRVPKYLRGLDREADWGYSEYCGWVYGYSYEVVVSATPKSVVFPLLASVDVASASEHRTFPPKIAQLPRSTRRLLIDAGYDRDETADRFELNARERRNGRRCLCAPSRSKVGSSPMRGRRARIRKRRAKRIAYFRSNAGQRHYAQRRQTVEPFNGIFKEMFEFSDHVWQRRLHNNRTTILMAIFVYQTLLRQHWKSGHRDAQVQYILDGL